MYIYKYKTATVITKSFRTIKEVLGRVKDPVIDITLNTLKVYAKRLKGRL